MIRILILAIIALAIYSLWKWSMNRFNRMRDNFMGQPDKPGKSKPSGEMSELIQDPVCKLFIAKDKAISYKGHFFCSEKCKSEFKEQN